MFDPIAARIENDEKEYTLPDPTMRQLVALVRPCAQRTWSDHREPLGPRPSASGRGAAQDHTTTEMLWASTRSTRPSLRVLQPSDNMDSPDEPLGSMPAVGRLTICSSTEAIDRSFWQAR